MLQITLMASRVFVAPDCSPPVPASDVLMLDESVACLKHRPGIQCRCRVENIKFACQCSTQALVEAEHGLFIFGAPYEAYR